MMADLLDLISVVRTALTLDWNLAVMMVGRMDVMTGHLTVVMMAAMMGVLLVSLMASMLAAM